MAACYGGIAFVIVQIIDGTFEVMGIPAWVSRLLITLLGIGFPIAIGLAWAFDITPEGIVRTEGRATGKPGTSNKALVAVTLFAIAFGIWARWGGGGTVGEIRSIAVLPLTNLMNDPDQDYFVDGMTEALITELSKISALRVIGRTSTMHYKNAPRPISEIADALDVDAVVEGSVLLAGEQVRITAQLVGTRPERHLWAEQFDRDFVDILALHSDVARAIAEQIKATLTPEEEVRLTTTRQVKPEAYNLYLRGWHFRKLESDESMPKAVEYLEQAVALDSTFARAWAALGHSYLQMQWNGGWDRDYAYNRMKPALDKALELDPNLPEAHAGLGIYYHFKVDLLTAELSFRRALELDSDNVYARYEYGVFLIRMGRLDESLGEFRWALKLDPLNPQPQWGIGVIYLTTRQYDRALEYFQAVLELAPGHWQAPGNMASAKREILMQQGRYAEAAAKAGKAGDLFLQLRAEWALGNRTKVYAVRDSLRSTGELQQHEQEHPFWSARLFAIMGEKDKVFSLLERAYEDTTKEFYYYAGLVYYPEFDFLRAEPRFKVLLKKMGLREVFDQSGQRIR